MRDSGVQEVQGVRRALVSRRCRKPLLPSADTAPGPPPRSAGRGWGAQPGTPNIPPVPPGQHPHSGPAPRCVPGGLPQGTGGSRGWPGGYWGPPARNPPARRPPPRPPDPAVPATAAPPRARRSRGRPVRWGEKPREGARGPLHWDKVALVAPMMAFNPSVP